MYLTNILSYQCLNNQDPSYNCNVSLHSDIQSYQTSHAAARRLSVPNQILRNRDKRLCTSHPVKIMSISQNMSLYSFNSASNMYLKQMTKGVF